MKLLPKIPKERQSPFILAVAVVLAILAAIYFGVIRAQHLSLSQIAADQRASETKLSNIEVAIKNSNVIEVQMEDATNALTKAEADMASGDLYSWAYGMMRTFKQKYHVDIPTIGQPTISDADSIPSYPFKQLRFTISGTAYYHDLGKFVADFENNFPHCRIINLTIETSNMGEKLSFQMDIAALIKTNLS